MDDRPPASKPDIQFVTFDAIMPAAMAVRAEEAGAARTAIDPLTLLMLSVLAGAFVAFGAVAATTVSAGAGELPFGIVRLLNGLVFCTGLILVVIGGAELFTGEHADRDRLGEPPRENPRRLCSTGRSSTWAIALARC